jgi:hypothetical protein
MNLTSQGFLLIEPLLQPQIDRYCDLHSALLVFCGQQVVRFDFRGGVDKAIVT